MSILEAVSFIIFSTTNILRGYSTGQLLFCRDIILPRKHTANWEFIHQENKTKIDKYNIHKNSRIVYHNFKVVDKLILNDNSAFKFETLYKGPLSITQCCTNVMVALQMGAIEISYNIRCIKPYKSDTHVEYFALKSGVLQDQIKNHQSKNVSKS